MEIWEILGISPVRDKKQIRRAYAVRSKVIHPEEKPEEFRKLYEAYRMALRYAETGAYHPDSDVSLMPESEEDRLGGKAQTASSSEKAEPGTERSEAFGGGRTDQDELAACFEELAREKGRKAAFFLERWKTVKEDCGDPKARMWWKEYLESKDFQDIQWHPGFVEFLSEDMERQLSDDYMIRQFFWDAYGFGDCGEQNYTYQGELLKLRRALYPAYERRKNTQRLHERALQRMYCLEMEDKSRRVMFWIVCLLVLIFVIYLWRTGMW